MNEFDSPLPDISKHDDEFIALIYDYFDGSITPDAMDKLNAELASNETKRKIFITVTAQRRALIEMHARGSAIADDSGEFMAESGLFPDLLESLAPKASDIQPVDISDVLKKREMEAKVKRAECHASFHRRFGRSAQQEGGSQTRHYVIPKPVFYGSIAAIVAVLLMVGYDLFNKSQEHPPTGGVQAERPVAATLIRTLNAVWAVESDAVRKNEEHGTETLSNGAKLREGDKYILEHGFAQIDTKRGAIVVLEAPCEIELLGDNHVKLTRGQLVGRCPTKQSKGFIVDTPGTRVTDLGTEFGVAVMAGSGETIEVFEGLVTAQPKGDGSDQVNVVEVSQGQTASTEHGSIIVTNSSLTSSRFANRRIFERYEQWQAYREKLESDPSLVAYYAFDQPLNDSLIESRGERIFDGVIHGPTWGPGRFPWKQGLHYAGPGSEDRVVLSVAASDRMNFGGSFSVAAWFKAEEFTSDFQNVISKGKNHWRLQSNTMFSSHPQRGDKAYEPRALQFGSTDPINQGDIGQPGKTPIDDGKWHLVVIVFEASPSGGIKHMYLDGRRDAAPQATKLMASTTERVWIGGNSERPNGREFHGVIDEVAIFERAMTGAEIDEMYRAGIPLK